MAPKKTAKTKKKSSKKVEEDRSTEHLLLIAVFALVAVLFIRGGGQLVGQLPFVFPLSEPGFDYRPQGGPDAYRMQEPQNERADRNNNPWGHDMPHEDHMPHDTEEGNAWDDYEQADKWDKWAEPEPRDIEKAKPLPPKFFRMMKDVTKQEHEEWDAYEPEPAEPAEPAPPEDPIDDLFGAPAEGGAASADAAAWDDVDATEGDSPSVDHPAAPDPEPEPLQCEDGVQVCRCYCRVSLTVCEDNETSNASMPLCKEEWDGGDCEQISFYDTLADDSSCRAKNGTVCEGYIRPGNGNPEELGNMKVEGHFLGCEVVAL